MLSFDALPQESYLRTNDEIQLIPFTEGRAYQGQQVNTWKKLSKNESGALGEKIAAAWMKQHRRIYDARPINSENKNYPVDLIGGNCLIEVKTGLISNGAKSHQWQAKIPQPSKAEAKKIVSMSPKKKAAWNKRKRQAVMDRKARVLTEMSQKHWMEMQPKTIGTIIHPDKRLVDVHVMHGYHHTITWKSEHAQSGYVGTYSY